MVDESERTNITKLIADSVLIATGQDNKVKEVLPFAVCSGGICSIPQQLMDRFINSFRCRQYQSCSSFGILLISMCTLWKECIS